MSERGTDVVFVGTGAIGLPMALRVAAAGSRVTAVEASPERRAIVVRAGLPVVCGSIGEAEPAAIVLVMVATGDQLSALVDQALPRGVRGETWVIMSTVGQDAVIDAAERLEIAGAECVDAPVTGGVAGAEAGTLRLFVSGGAEPIAQVWSVLETVGRPVVVGPSIGDGQAIKVVNQHLCTVHLAAAGEALELAAAMGLDPELVLELLSSGAAASWMLGDRGPRMLHPDGRVTSTIDIFVKDSGLVAAAAAGAGFDAVVLEAARSRFVAASEAGRGRDDDSTVNLTYRKG